MCIRRSPGRPAPWGRIYPSTSTHRFPPGRRKRTSCREQETTATHQKQTRKSRTERGKVARLDGVKGVCCCCCCVFVPSILATVPPIKARRALENCTGSVHFSVQLQLPGVTQEGGFFLLALVFFAPPSSCDACLHFLSKEAWVRLFLSLVNNEVELCLIKKLFTYRSLSTARHESEKKPTFAEIRTRDLVARRLRGYQLDPPGRP